MSTKMHSTLEKWLSELEQETVILASDEINEEARGNMGSFGFDEVLLQEWGKESVNQFIHGCADLYRRKSCGLNMIFYSWFDEQTGQIRISAVRQAHGKLPFGCKLKLSELTQVVDGIFSNNSGVYSKGALDVWCQNL